MRLGFCLPQNGENAGPEALVAVSQPPSKEASTADLVSRMEQLWELVHHT